MAWCKTRPPATWSTAFPPTDTERPTPRPQCPWRPRRLQGGGLSTSLGHAGPSKGGVSCVGVGSSDCSSVEVKFLAIGAREFATPWPLPRALRSSPILVAPSLREPIAPAQIVLCDAPIPTHDARPAAPCQPAQTAPLPGERCAIVATMRDPARTHPDRGIPPRENCTPNTGGTGLSPSGRALEHPSQYCAQAHRLGLCGQSSQRSSRPSPRHLVPVPGSRHGRLL